MPRILGWIAVVGIGVGFASLSLAWTIGGRDLTGVLADINPDLRSCEDSKVAGGPERRLRWTGDDTVEVVTAASLRLIAGTGSEVIVRGAPQAIAHLQLRGGRLSADCRLRPSQPIEVELPARSLRHVRISGSGRVAMEKLDQPELTLTISGSGHMQVNGMVERVSATISGSGDIRLGDVALKRLAIRISGSGDLEAAPKDEADVTISGSGHVRLLTRPANLRSKLSGSGRITQPPV